MINDDPSQLQTEVRQEFSDNEEISSIEAQLAFLDDSIVDAKAKFKAESRTKRGYWYIAGACACGLGLHYTQTTILPSATIAVAWLLMLMFGMAGLGSDPEKFKIELRNWKRESAFTLIF